MPAQATVRVRRQDGLVLAHVEGKGTIAQSLPLRQYAERELAAGAEAMRVDLRRCPYVDSTFVGTLLRLMRAFCAQRPGSFSLVSPSPECRGLLDQMGLTEFLPAAEAEEPGDLAAWQTLSRDVDDVAAFRCNVVQAHRTLADLPGKAGAPFQEVARCLEEAETEKGGS